MGVHNSLGSTLSNEFFENFNEVNECMHVIVIPRGATRGVGMESDAIHDIDTMGLWLHYIMSCNV